MDVMEEIKNTVENNPIVLFMKGSPDFPQCGFSMKTVQALKECDVEFSFVDVLAQPEMRANLPQYSNWPTFPQVFVNGELVGGCDIVMELFEKGELQKMTQEAVNK
ncbi:MAG: Grx4 family monothiol glutaredoxin [Proteobacteria bacterium]|nr:Grx4 family monothiol glutaredoxin [Pseudomonadota bacterium]